MTAGVEIQAKGAGQTRIGSSGRIPSLDGLRAVSIALVVGYHVLNAQTQVQLHHDYEGPWRHLFSGGLGVSIFFVISGFLITHLLLREMEKTKTISLIDFYIRRTFRIWPAFYFYLGIIIALHAMNVIGIARRDVVAAGFVFWYAASAIRWWDIRGRWRWRNSSICFGRCSCCGLVADGGRGLL